MKLLLAAALCAATATAAAAQAAPSTAVPLPAPRRAGPMSLEAALWARQSVRALARDSAVALADAGQLLWAGQGVNRPANGHRTAPSAGATYPLELFLVASRVAGLAPGVYHYRPATHDLEPVASGDRLKDLVDAAVHQAWVSDAAGVIVFAAVPERAARFGPRADRFVPMDVGFAGENVYLQAAALGLATTFAGSVQDTAAVRVLGLPAEAHPLGIMPFGRPR